MIDPARYARYLEALLAGDRAACREVVERLIAEGVDLRTLYTGLFQRSLYDVGSLWESGRVSVAVEHMATAVTESLMPLAYPALFSVRRCGKKAVVACLAGEQHQVGARMVADILELRGWDAYFLGAGVPRADLERFIEEHAPDLACLSMAISSNYPEFLAVLESLAERFPALPVAVGGQGFRFVGHDVEARFQGLRRLDTLELLEAHLETL